MRLRFAMLVAATLSAFAGSGCDFDWEKPGLGAPPPERFRAAAPRSAPPLRDARDFAALFRSRELTGLVDQALENRPTLAITI